MQRFGNPARFTRLSAAVQPWCGWLAAGLIAVGLYVALFASPPDYQQGEAVRIMYVHVPSAYMALFVYTVVAAASAAALIWRHPLAHVAAEAAAPIGACFTFLALATGALWGKPMWGTWWVWDARLTSVLVLFFLYLGFIALRGAFDDAVRGQRAAAILALVGFVNVPIIKFSVNWWNTLHQPSSLLRLEGPALHGSMLLPLLLMASGFTFFFAALLMVRMRSALLARRVRALTVAGVYGARPAGPQTAPR